MEKKSKTKIRKWDEVGGAAEMEPEETTEITEEVPGAGPAISKNYMRGIEDMVEQNDNSFDGVINNLPAPKPVCQVDAAEVIEDEQEKKSILKKLQETTVVPENPKSATACQLCDAMER